MTAPFVVENTKERNRLKDLVGRLSDAQLTRTFDYGWTVAAALAHLAFWDHRSFIALQKIKATHKAPEPFDFDTINDALLPLCMAIAPHEAARLAIAAAEKVDKDLESLTPEQAAAVEAMGERSRLYRCVHRKMHLDEIDQLIAKE
ncbi:MAG: maleylpyruvate isomerase N-terminal domain-containing protein [Desulfobacteraceae bacterium]|nr:maleylpyruvate isomerase N-terminal domain-containing protein [Desulfobacteraceae bacterium]